MENHEDKIKFSRLIQKYGGSLAITIPQEVAAYLELNEGEEIEMIAEKGKHGRYAAFWKKR